jgi:hypothetical protein
VSSPTSDQADRTLARAVAGLLVASVIVLLATPLRWFEVHGFGINLSFSALDTLPLGIFAALLVVTFAVTALVVRRSGRQAWFLLSLCVAFLGLFVALFVFVARHVIASVLPLPTRVENAAPGPGPGLGFVLLGCLLASASSTVGLLAKAHSTAIRPAVPRPVPAPEPMAADDLWEDDPDVPAF